MSEDGQDIRAMLAKAEQARGHAKNLMDAKAAKALNGYADEPDGKIAALRELRNPKDVPTLPEQAANAPTGEPPIGPELLAAMKTPEEENSPESNETNENP